MAKNNNEKIVNTILAEDIKFSGTIKFQTTLEIKGEFTGNIVSEEGNLYISPKAFLKAEILANNIDHYGQIEGKLKANQCLKVFKGAYIKGDITTEELSLEKGAFFEGTCHTKKMKKDSL